MESPAGFVHLRTHSAYSLSEGAIRIPDLLGACQAQEMPAVAVTDTDNLFGALEFCFAAQKQGIQPIPGCQIGLQHRDSAAGRSGEAPPPLVLLAQTETGYRNLLRLLSQAYLATQAGERPKVSLDGLAAYSAGLICLTGGAHGPVGTLIREGRTAVADQVVGRLESLFPGRLYIELQRHGDGPGQWRTAAEATSEEPLIEVAYRRELPLVATNEPFFLGADAYQAHDALLCIAEGAYVTQEDRRRVTRDHYLKTPAEMAERFSDLPEAIDNTVTVARRCSYMPEPIDPILPPSDLPQGRSESQALYEQAEAGLARRLATQVYTADMDDAARERAAQPYWDRLAHEHDIITRMGFPGYFLIVADFIQWAKSRDIPVGPGRGSGAGSLIAWALTITDLDPLRFNLLFERFLNPERVSMPDFDIDFCQERRDEVLAYVQDKYGQDKVAQIITFGKLQARAVLRDVGRVLQMPFGQVDKICKLVPHNPANPPSLDEAIENEPQLQAWIEQDETVQRLVELARPLEGLYRHASTHAAGVVIGDRPLQELVPLYRDPRADMPVTQFNMKYVEQAGLVKFDFLGLKTLTVLQTAQHHIQRLGATPPDLETLPFDDRTTFDMLMRGETVGVFQLESGGMRDVLRRLRPDRFEDIIAVVALYRPGPMENIPRFIACKHGQEDVDYMHPTLQPILAETFGVMIYQEQVMQAAQRLAGYSLGAADLLRRAMGKKIQAEMDKQHDLFIEGAVARGVERETAARIFSQVSNFAGYGFNKSHAAAYALVAYQTAYMKANHPAAFLAASMTYDMASTEKLAVFHQDLKRLGYALLPPDVNYSGVHFTVEWSRDRTGTAVPAVRYGLAALKGVGEGATTALVEARQAGGAFADLFDFAGRIDPASINRKVLENLAVAGAFDSLNPNRRQVHDSLDTLLRYSQELADQKASGQASLFGGPGGDSLPRPALAAVADWDKLERLQYEYDTIGFYLSAHPLDDYAGAFERLGITRFDAVADALGQGGSSRLKMAGLVTGVQIRRSAKGNRFAFAQLSDMSGAFEVTVFSDVLATSQNLLVAGTPVLATVDVQGGAEDRRFTAQRVESLDDAVAGASQRVTVYLDSTAPIEHIRAVLDRHGRGRAQIRLVVPLADQPGGEAALDLPQRYALGREGRKALKDHPGVAAVREG